MKRRLAGFRVLFLDDRKLAWAEAGGRVLAKLGLAPKLRAQLKIARPLYDFLKGVPNREALRGTLWRVRDRFEGELSDPLTTSAGFTWVSPIVPLVGAAAREVTELMSGIYRRHGFDPLISYTLITERALCCVSNIAFDKRVASEVEAARACYAELTGALVRAGYPLYRASIEGFESLSKDSHGFWEVVRALKHALDPHDLMSPGRYLPPSSVARVN